MKANKKNLMVFKFKKNAKEFVKVQLAKLDYGEFLDISLFEEVAEGAPAKRKAGITLPKTMIGNIKHAVDEIAKKVG